MFVNINKNAKSALETPFCKRVREKTAFQSAKSEFYIV